MKKLILVSTIIACISLLTSCYHHTRCATYSKYSPESPKNSQDQKPS